MKLGRCDHLCQIFHIGRFDINDIFEIEKKCYFTIKYHLRYTPWSYVQII